MLELHLLSANLRTNMKLFCNASPVIFFNLFICIGIKINKFEKA